MQFGARSRTTTVICCVRTVARKTFTWLTTDSDTMDYLRAMLLYCGKPIAIQPQDTAIEHYTVHLSITI
eukprot:6173306-Pleurochrysis_carterae.AAC.2